MVFFVLPVTICCDGTEYINSKMFWRVVWGAGSGEQGRGAGSGVSRIK